MPQGAHLRLDPAVDVDSLGLHPVARMLAEAAQRYGVIVRDRTRVSAQFFLESPPRDQRSPYTGAGGLFAGARRLGGARRVPVGPAPAAADAARAARRALLRADARLRCPGGPSTNANVRSRILMSPHSDHVATYR